MNTNATQEMEKKQTAILIFNIFLMISSFVIALVALPYEIFFIVAVIILFALRDIEKDIARFKTKRLTIFSDVK